MCQYMGRHEALITNSPCSAGILRSVAGACLSRARPFFLAPIYFLAPATQATCSVY